MESVALSRHRWIQIRSPRTDRPFVVDFVCRERRLIVEVDGGQHANDEHDLARTSWLQGRGYNVMRFWNNDVIGNIDGVLETIGTALTTESPPHPEGRS